MAPPVPFAAEITALREAQRAREELRAHFRAALDRLEELAG